MKTLLLVISNAFTLVMCLFFYSQCVHEESISDSYKRQSDEWCHKYYKMERTYDDHVRWEKIMKDDYDKTAYLKRL